MLSASRRYRRKSGLRSLLTIVVVALVVVGGMFSLHYFGFVDNSTIATSPKTTLSWFIEIFPNRSVREYVTGLLGDMHISSVNRPKEDSPLVAKIALVSDSHSSVETFSKVLNQIILDRPDVLIHLGDVVVAGELSDLETMKGLLDQTGLRYYVLPGDHDYNWIPQHDLSNFFGVFYEGTIDRVNKVVEVGGFQLLLYENSSNTTRVNEQSLAWLRSLIGQDNALDLKGRFLFTSTPPINPYFSEKQDVNGRELLEVLALTRIDQIFSGDMHIYARFTDEATGITITTVGASGDYKNPLPQYVVLELFEDGTFDIKARPVVDLESID